MNEQQRRCVCWFSSCLLISWVSTKPTHQCGRKETYGLKLSSLLFNRSPSPLVSFESMVNISRLQWTPSGPSRLRKNINFSLISRGNSESLLAWSVARGCWTCAVCYLNSVTCDLCEKGTTCHWGVVWLWKMDGVVGPMMVSVLWLLRSSPASLQEEQLQFYLSV